MSFNISEALKMSEQINCLNRTVFKLLPPFLKLHLTAAICKINLNFLNKTELKLIHTSSLSLCMCTSSCYQLLALPALK